MKNFNNMMNTMAVKTMVATATAKERICGILAQNKGEGFVDTALKILISVVVGALLLSGLYLLFKDTILPTLTTRITELFDYKG